MDDVDTDLGFHTAVKYACSCKWTPLSIPSGFNDDRMERDFLQKNQIVLKRMMKLVTAFTLTYVGIACFPLLKAEGVLGGTLHRTHIICWCARLVLAVVPGATLFFRPTEGGACVFAALEVIAVLVNSRFRAACLAGELEDLSDIFAAKSAASLHSDASVMISIALICIFLQGVPIRAKLNAGMLLLVPVVYAIFTVPLPAGLEEGRVLQLTAQVAGIAVLSFFVRVHLEVKERREFYIQCKLKDMLTKEKVKRVTAEHEAAHGPFSSRGATNISPKDACEEYDRASETISNDLSSIIFGRALPNDMTSLRRSAIVKAGTDEFWYIGSDQIEIFADSAVGQGGFGKVFRGRYQAADVALKVTTRDVSDPALVSELRILRRVRHPNLVFFFGASFAGEHLVVVEELITGSTLGDLMKAPGKLSEKDRLTILCGIASAVVHLHSHSPGIVHGDLKPENVLVEAGSSKVKVIDFGLSCLVKPTSKYQGVSHGWASPEVLRCDDRIGKSPSPASDVFTFGLIAFFVVVGHRPSAGMSTSAWITLMRQGCVQDLKWPEPPVALQHMCYELCCLCLHPNAASRPSAETMLGNVLQWASTCTVQSL
eukprot:TRINITY_DN9002_c0_g1_i1.p1 TRINITY_DN9002_c0_g1~~TRINITY_DN9002_c0_g1_i1.p1  ORF type:complete len:626 (-),score=89.81 TRINITY_DN9002_c0_g1_i1:17-1813(-)